MLNWGDVHAKINKTSHEFNLLQNKFNEYFHHIECQVKDPILSTKGIKVHKDRDDSFTANFAGRGLTFVFTTMLNGSGTLVGRITVYMLCKFPEEKFTQIDSFEFATSGKTTLSIEDQDDAPVELNHDAHALCIFLEILCKSLSY